MEERIKFQKGLVIPEVKRAKNFGLIGSFNTYLMRSKEYGNLLHLSPQHTLLKRGNYDVFVTWDECPGRVKKRFKDEMAGKLPTCRLIFNPEIDANLNQRRIVAGAKLVDVCNDWDERAERFKFASLLKYVSGNHDEIVFHVPHEILQKDVVYQLKVNDFDDYHRHFNCDVFSYKNENDDLLAYNLRVLEELVY